MSGFLIEQAVIYWSRSVKPRTSRFRKIQSYCSLPESKCFCKSNFIVKADIEGWNLCSVGFFVDCRTMVRIANELYWKRLREDLIHMFRHKEILKRNHESKIISETPEIAGQILFRYVSYFILLNRNECLSHQIFEQICTK